MNVPDGSREKTSLSGFVAHATGTGIHGQYPYTVNRHQTNTSFIDSEKEKTK